LHLYIGIVNTPPPEDWAETLYFWVPYLRLRECYSTPPKSHYLFDDKFGRPARGNDKGNFEGMVGYTRRNFMVPAPC